MEVLFAFLIFFVGVLGGFFIHVWLASEKAYAGAILVKKAEGKTVYSLEIYSDLDTLDQNEQLLFKVIPPEESLDRE